MSKQRLDEDYVKRFIIGCREEASAAKRTRMVLNRDNFDMYHLRHDFSHKRDGQSTEVLSKQKMAVEQIRSFFQQALVDLGEWWRAVPRDGSDGSSMTIRPEEIQHLTNYMLKQARYYSHVGNSVQQALLGSLSVTKIHGCAKSKPKYKVRSEGRGKSYKRYVETAEGKTWELALDIIRQENYYPDPTGADLYRIEDSYIDLTEVRRLATGEDAIYDMSVVAKLQPWTGASDTQEYKKAREQGQNLPVAEGMRPRVKITEFWGTIIDQKTGETLCENCVTTLANDTHVIRKPTPNPLWHQKTPINAAPLVEVANSVWHTALMDAATKHNRALIEMFNLTVDAAMMEVHAIKQLRTDCLADPKQVSDGIKAGDTLQVTAALPPGAKVLEPVTAVEIPAQALNVMNIISQEFNASALTNDLRQGVMPFRAVKATEVVEASNTITSVFQGIAKNVEAQMIQPEIELAWQTIAQNWDLIDREVFLSLFGAERGEQLSQIPPQDVFVATVNGVKFEVYGITLTLGKAQDFRKYMQLLQTVGGSEILTEEFIKKYDFGKLLGEVMTSLDLNKKKIELDRTEQQLGAAPAGAPMEQAGGTPGAAPNQMSQVPQAGAGSLADIFQQPNFPGSPALAGRGQ
jgi:hypothetical protein